MSTPPAKTTAPRDPFGLLKAILMGSALGFIAMMLVPYLLPMQEARQRAPNPQTNLRLPVNKPAPKAAQPEEAGNKVPGEDKGSSNGSARDAKAQSAEGGIQPQVPASPAPSASLVPSKDNTPAAPVLIPAVNLDFPKPFSDKAITASLRPLLSFKISDDDAAAVKEVISAVSKGDGDAARAAIKKISDPAAKTFAEWKRLRAPNGDLREIMAFQRAHPLFPEPGQDGGIEKSLFLSDVSSADILKFYGQRIPLTGAGKASLGAALMETGERERGLKMIKFAWSRYPFDSVIQERFVSRFGSLLTDRDQERRKLLLAARAKQLDGAGKNEDSEVKGWRGAARIRAKWRGSHSLRGRHGKGFNRAARVNRRRHGELRLRSTQEYASLDGKARMFSIKPLTVEVQLKKANAKSEENGNQGRKNGDPRDNGKPASPDNDSAKSQGKGEKASDKTKEDKPPQKTLQAKIALGAFKLSKERAGGSATLLARLKTLRRESADDDVWSLLRSVEADTADLADPDRWWDFRATEVRRALNEDRPKTAYAIAKIHGPLDDERRSEAEFLAGWIALRFLKDPHRAQTHFEAARTIKGFARDEARATYWLGRTKLELGSRKEAEALFREASAWFHTFYGSLARQALRSGAACEFRAPPNPAKETVAAFVNEDAFKAIMIAKQLDLQPLLVSLALDLARQVSDPEQMTLLLELTERTGPPHVAIRAAKIALLRGLPAEAYAYPTLLPKYDPISGSGKVEPALLNALTRQESEFNTGSVSPVGARGLMQLMPQTAKLVAVANKMKYELPRLISDPSYNVTLGSAFLAQLISGYDGSYVLSLAAYNAGPGRVAQWIKDFGDPRDKSIDPIDWVERIPFTETRHYLERILESTQLYRCRFENGKARFQIIEDLHRGRPGKIPNLTDVPGSAELDQTP
jgi:soluble lytic murein transglycosylase